MQAPFTQPKDRTASRVVSTRRQAQRILRAGERAGRPGVIHGHRSSFCVLWDLPTQSPNQSH